MSVFPRVVPKPRMYAIWKIKKLIQENLFVFS